MVLEVMVNIVIFYTKSSKEKAMKLFLKFENNLNNNDKIIRKDNAILCNECFMIKAIPLTQSNIRGACYHLAYIPNDIDYEIECYIRGYGHTTKIEKYYY